MLDQAAWTRLSQSHPQAGLGLCAPPSAEGLRREQGPGPCWQSAKVWLNAAPLQAGAVLNCAGLSVFRVSDPRNGTPLLLHHVAEEAWLAVLDLAGGALSIHDLARGWQDALDAPFDRLLMRLPRRADGPALRTVAGIADPVALALGDALLPALAGAATPGIVQSLLAAMQAHLARAYAPAAPAQAPEAGRCGLAPWQLRKAKAMIEAHLESGVSVEEIARECRLSRSYFSRAFRRSTGVPPHGFLAALRLEKAKRLLAGPEARIADVAVECGFADQSHLTRSFAARLGTTPAAWRRQARSAGEALPAA